MSLTPLWAAQRLAVPSPAVSLCHLATPQDSPANRNHTLQSHSAHKVYSLAKHGTGTATTPRHSAQGQCWGQRDSACDTEGRQGLAPQHQDTGRQCTPEPSQGGLTYAGGKMHSARPAWGAWMPQSCGLSSCSGGTEAGTERCVPRQLQSHCCDGAELQKGWKSHGCSSHPWEPDKQQQVCGKENKKIPNGRFG